MNSRIKLTDYHLSLEDTVSPKIINHIGAAYVVDKDNFSALAGITCYTLEIWEECMRLPHWHPNAAELGYVVSGEIEIILWRSPGESAIFTLTAGMCWFIPQGALHSLNNIGRERAKLLVGFSNERPGDIDLPVAFNGIPAPVRDAYTSPHTDLKKWQGVVSNPLLGLCKVDQALHQVITGSPYGFDFAKVTPLFNDVNLGSVIWGVKSNWAILENISILRAHLKPGAARDAIWYPDAGTLYVVSQGSGTFHLTIANLNPLPIQVKQHDYIFVPEGILHTFINTSTAEDFEVIAFFTKADPQPEVSLSVATALFPNSVRKAALTEYGEVRQSSDPLHHLNYTQASPYLLKCK